MMVGGSSGGAWDYCGSEMEVEGDKKTDLNEYLRKVEELDEAIKFGKNLGKTDSFLGHGIYYLESLMYDETDKKRFAGKMIGYYRDFVQKMDDEIRINYGGVPTAEDALEYAHKKLDEFEELAKQFLE